jgi:hypothetical protein
MTYDECVVNAAIAIFSSRQISGPQSAIDLAEVLADALKANDYLEDNGPSSTTSNDRVSTGSGKG